MGRLTYIDTAKFLAIYFVIISHCSMSSHIAHFLFSFHVPLFFVLYGYVHRIRENETIRCWLYGGGKKLIYRILIPYFLLAFILGNPLSVKNVCFVSFGAIQSLTDITSTHLWFLPCYFASVVFYNMISIKLKGNYILCGFCFVLFSIISALLNFDSNLVIPFKDKLIYLTGKGHTDVTHFYLGFPFAINVALSGCLFIYLGRIIKMLFSEIKLYEKTLMSWFVFILALIMGYICFVLNDGFDKLLAMSLAKYENYILFVLTAICISIATIILAKWIDNPIFAKYGKYTMAIYGFHLALTFVPQLIYKITCFPIESHAELKGVMSGSIVLVVSCMLIPIIRNIDSNLIGEQK